MPTDMSAIYQAAKVMETDTPEQKLEKLAAYAKKMEDDLAAYAALQGRVLRIREVLAKMDDTQTAIGSDIMVAASEGYALMKLFGKAEGLSELQQAMRVRRPGRRRKGDAAAG